MFYFVKFLDMVVVGVDVILYVCLFICELDVYVFGWNDLYVLVDLMKFCYSDNLVLVCFFNGMVWCGMIFDVIFWVYSVDIDGLIIMFLLLLGSCDDIVGGEIIVQVYWVGVLIDVGIDFIGDWIDQWLDFFYEFVIFVVKVGMLNDVVFKLVMFISVCVVGQ